MIKHGIVEAKFADCGYVEMYILVLIHVIGSQSFKHASATSAAMSFIKIIIIDNIAKPRYALKVFQTKYTF